MQGAAHFTFCLQAFGQAGADIPPGWSAPGGAPCAAARPFPPRGQVQNQTPGIRHGGWSPPGWRRCGLRRGNRPFPWG